jgi:hypothetical protein
MNEGRAMRLTRLQLHSLPNKCHIFEEVLKKTEGNEKEKGDGEERLLV